jgi:hypothetical protein
MFFLVDLRTRVLSCAVEDEAIMNCLRSSVVAMMGALLLLSTAFAQVKTSFVARSPANENPKTWTRFTSHTDKFEVLMPAAPTLKQETLVVGGQQLLLSYYGARRGETDYAVLTLAGFNGSNWHVPHMLMLDLYCRSNAGSQGAGSVGSFKAIFQKDISLAGYAGKQFSLERNDRVGEWRIYEVNKTFYAIAGSSNSRSTYSLRRFFDSFSLAESNSTVANASSAEGKRVSNPTARWLIILQTFSRNERVKANRRMHLLQGQGFDIQVISTDSYSNLRPGLLALAMGPFSRRAAEQRLSELRLVAPQSYIKAGW